MLCVILMDTYAHHVSDKIDGIDPVIILAKKKRNFHCTEKAKIIVGFFFKKQN